MSDERVPQTYSLDLGDWPGGSITAFDCAYEGAPDGGLDLVTPETCPEHGRSIYWCLNAGVFWCDGGSPFDYQHIVGVLR